MSFDPYANFRKEPVKEEKISDLPDPTQAIHDTQKFTLEKKEPFSPP